MMPAVVGTGAGRSLVSPSSRRARAGFGPRMILRTAPRAVRNASLSGGSCRSMQRSKDVEFAGLGYRNHAIGERFHQAPCEADSSQSNRGRSRKALNIFSFQRRQKSRKNSESASSDS